MDDYKVKYNKMLELYGRLLAENEKLKIKIAELEAIIKDYDIRPDS